MSAVERDAEQYEVVSAGYTAPLLAAAGITAGDRVLDVGCGYGTTTRAAALLAGSGRVLGNDLSPAMVAGARALSAGAGHVVFEAGDAQTHPFPDGGFDVAISRMGVMFFADPVAAFANIGRALRPGGRLAIATVGAPEHNDLPGLVAAAAPGADAVLALSDPAHLTAVVSAAGFQDITVRPVATTIALATDPAAAAEFICEWGAFRGFLTAGPAEGFAARRAAAAAALTVAAQRFHSGEGILLRSSAWLVTAVRPA
ncbi:methyltransferase [Actinoplanes capillaceus]|uniref:Methyltransferase n=1 Tax=Actinoplanes campanulatus TaxID=113559 RepID=A0ABQ3WPN2_9ACTN|nr:class I SAM-dependent methyltransferase [Actinoplanes capillaceus]GID48214.1 methyltransferase [Actinoplanes capillaceus]